MSFYKYFVNSVAPLIKIYHRVEVSGIENLPAKGKGFIIAANHCNWLGWDALVVSSILKDREIHWISWSYDWINPLWDLTVKLFNGILYNNYKRFPYEEVVENILKKGNIVGIFPEGNNNSVVKQLSHQQEKFGKL